MSRYILKTTDPHHEGFIGWDAMLNTFFVHIIDTSKEEDSEDYDVAWAGTARNEIHDIETVIAIARRYANVGNGMELWLYYDANG